MHLKIKHSKQAETLGTIDFFDRLVYYKHIKSEIIN